MLKRDYQSQNCSIARTLELVGERWTLLIIRDAFRGLHRFDEFQANLGIATNVLASRLERLVDAGIFERVRYQERPDRYEYHLTPSGRELRVARETGQYLELVRVGVEPLGDRVDVGGAVGIRHREQ